MPLGDILYRGALLWNRLVGNTTTTKKFLSQTGTGVISAIPVWDAIDGSSIAGFTSGSVIFGNTDGTLTQNNTKFFWDNTPETLKITHNTGVLDSPETNAKPQIHIGGDFDGVAAGIGVFYVDGYGAQGNITMRRADGTQASKSAVATNAIIFNFRSYTWDGSDYGLGGLMRMIANGAQSGANHGQDFLVLLTANGSVANPSEVFRLTTEGLRIGANLGTVATTGVIRIPNNQYMYSRGNTAIDIRLIGATNNVVSVGDVLRVCQLSEVWETEPGNGDFRPITNNARNIGGSTRLALNVFTSKLTNPAQTTTSTGNQAAFAVTSTCLRANNATTLTLQGIVAGESGQDLEIWAIGAGQVDIANASGSASAANQILTPTGATVTVTAAVGYAKLRYDGTTAKWRLLHST